MSTLKLGLVDRMLLPFVPGAVRERVKARAQIEMAQALAGGVGASASTAGGEGGFAAAWNRHWSPGLRDSAGDTLRHLPRQRSHSRDLVRTNAIAASAINTNVNRVIGTGLALSAQPHLATLGWTPEQGEAWRTRVHARFSLWADSPECDLRSTQNFYELQDLVLRSMLESGDVFTVLPDGEPTATQPYRLRLQVIEADRVGNPLGKPDTADVAGGVRRKPSGALDAFHVYDQHPGSTLLKSRSVRYAGQWVDAVGRSGRRRILHHFKTLRPEQPRGVPYLAPVMQLFKDLGTYTDAEIKAAVVSAFLTVFIETESGAMPAPVYDGQQAGAAADAPTANVELGPAAAIALAKGEKANVVNPGRPNPAFGPFVQVVLDQLGAGLSIGPEMLIKRYSTSYTAARAAFLDAWTHFRGLRTLIARSFCQPVYETWMAEAVARGDIAAPGFFADPLMRWAYTRTRWTGDSQGSLNPKDEVKAFLDAVDGRLTTREHAEWELFGTDFGETYPVKKAEHDRMRDDGMLPLPKAGAAAPTSPKPEPSTEEA